MEGGVGRKRRWKEEGMEGGGDGRSRSRKEKQTKGRVEKKRVGRRRRRKRRDEEEEERRRKPSKIKLSQRSASLIPSKENVSATHE